MLTKRQESVLKLIIEEYVKTAEPVGSRTLSKLLDFSSATIRNEMADLEELGFLEKTHTSSGRIPSDVFVESKKGELIVLLLALSVTTKRTLFCRFYSPTETLRGHEIAIITSQSCDASFGFCRSPRPQS
jgi:hypothetical protein